MTFVPSVNQQNFFNALANTSSSIVLEAVAGAGKTTTVLEGLKFLRGTTVLTAFNNKMVKELKEKVAEAGITGVDTKTLHGAGYSALRKAFRNEGFNSRDPDDKKVLRIAEALISEQQRRDLEGLESAVASMVSMAKQRGIGALSPINDDSAWYDMVDHFALDDNLPEGKEHMVPQLVKMAQICLRRSNEDLSVIDFDDMVYLPLQRNLRLWQYDNVIIDEAQDTNPTRRALARKMLRPGGRMIAVGDRHQAIYGFTGTDNDSLDQIAEDFDCVRLPLTVTYRCPKAVVRVANEWVHHIEAHETAPEGEVVEYDYSEIMTQAQLGDAILCRFNKYLVSLVFKFIRAGIAAKIEGRAIGHGLAKLAGRWKSIKTLNALETKLEEHFERQIEKAKAKDDERRIEEHRDLHETMLVLIDRAREQKMSQVSELQAMIMSIFEDDIGESRRIITLCSEHRAKGLEWDRVHVLGLRELQPARCSREWQMAQEINLMYVAVTRAKKVLHIVSGVREEEEKPRRG
jgi:DNA helicase-2/ATP-dependent DNA helicase PcrA